MREARASWEYLYLSKSLEADLISRDSGGGGGLHGGVCGIQNENR